jgi:hypothetical protein
MYFEVVPDHQNAGEQAKPKVEVVDCDSKGSVTQKLAFLTAEQQAVVRSCSVVLASTVWNQAPSSSTFFNQTSSVHSLRLGASSGLQSKRKRGRPRKNPSVPDSGGGYMRPSSLGARHDESLSATEQSFDGMDGGGEGEEDYGEETEVEDYTGDRGKELSVIGDYTGDGGKELAIIRR